MTNAYIDLPSPNFDSREHHVIDMLVLHYTGMRSATEALERLCDVAAKVSAHYMVDEDGTVMHLVDENMRAWHAGVSYWRGEGNINQRSIGIEIVNPGHEFGYRSFPSAQMQAVGELCQDILSRHDISARNVVAHSDVAPSRKEDPGELFDWKSLAALGIGLWPIEAPTPATVEKLTDYGYDYTHPEKTITAFQRRFRPQLLNGLWDDECGRLLAALLEMV